MPVGPPQQVSVAEGGRLPYDDVEMQLVPDPWDEKTLAGRKERRLCEGQGTLNPGLLTNISLGGKQEPGQEPG